MSKRTADGLFRSSKPVRWENIPRRFTKPMEIMMAPAQKKPSLNWVADFHPSIKPAIATTIAALSEKRLALIRMRGILFFIASSIVREDENKLANG
jgi:hypothetical protein